MTEFNEAQNAEQAELKRLQQVEELEKLLDEQSDEEFGATEFQVASDDKKAVLKEWTAQDFANIYTRFRPHLERHARRFLRNPSQVDEVVQDAFLYLMVTLPELDSELGVLKFLKWKVRLLCLDVIRAGSKAQLSDIDAHGEFTADNEPVDENIERVEDAAIVRMALSKLQPRHREVLLASMYEEKSTPEIAAQVGLSENATRQLMFRARAALKKALVGEVETHGMTLNQILSVVANPDIGSAEQKVTVGTFNGFIAIFTRGYEGKKMTAKVAGKWLVVNPIENYKNFDYSRTTRNTGAGYLINVDVYIGGVLKESTQVLTR